MSVKYTSLNSASPVIWRSGRTSTPGRFHVDDEGRQPGVLDRLRIGAHDEQTPPRDVGERRPHLLPVDDPLVAVADAAGGESGEVGTGARFGEQLAPDLLAGEQRAQVALLLLGVPHVISVGATMPCPIGLRHMAFGAPAAARRSSIVRWCFGLSPSPPSPGGEVHPRQAAVELRAEELDDVGRRPAG